MAHRVIVVEDDLLNRMLFTTWLQDRGCEVEEHGEGRRAVAAARRFRPDLVVLDIRLPDMPGTDVIAGLKADPELARVPILAVTGCAAREDEARIRGAGACAYLAKPVTQRKFDSAVNSLLAEALQPAG